MINRVLQSTIEQKMFQGKAIILVGSRQTGKTTLLNLIAEKQSQSVLFWNCDEPETRDFLTNTNISELRLAIGDHTIIIIDEAQNVDNIGLTLKLIIDNFKDIQILATGSSSFDLRNRLNEPLTGRKWEYQLFPISSAELIASKGLLEEKRLLESRLIYGSYPDIIMQQKDAKELLLNLAGSYLYKDILSLEDVRKPVILDKLFVALALQIGSEVSYNELAKTVQADSKTVEKYIELLERCYVVFRLHAFSRNLRNELKKSRKIYFYDTGIRNAILQNFAPISLRQDIGALWENFFIAERIKRNHYSQHYARIYFWRTIQQQEIDFIEESDGQITAFEIKWNENKKVKFPTSFTSAYSIKDTFVVTPNNYLEYLL